MIKKPFEKGMSSSVSRRTLLHGGAGLIGGTMLSGGLIRPAMAVGQDPIGTWPALARLSLRKTILSRQTLRRKSSKT